MMKIQPLERTAIFGTSNLKRSNIQFCRELMSRRLVSFVIAVFVSTLANSAYGSGLPKDGLVGGYISSGFEVAEEIQNLPDSTEALDLYCRTPADLGVLRRLKNLRRLEIGGAEYVADRKSIAALGELPIESLYIRADDGRNDFISVLNRFKSLKNLSVVSPVHKISLREISKIRTIECLNSYGPMSGSVSELRACPRLRSLRLTNIGNKTSDDSVLRGIKFLPKLERLCIRGHRVSPRILKEVCTLPNLQSLDVSEMNLTDDDMRSIAQLSSLETLNLSGNPITDQGVMQIRSLKHLRALNLSKTKITDSAFESISALPALEELDVISTTTNAMGLKYLQGQKSLRRLVLSAVLNRNLEPLKNFTSLEFLDLRGASIDETGAQFISQSSSVRYLHIGRFENENDLERLRGMSSLQNLRCDVTTDNERHVISSLNKTPVPDDWLIHDLHDLRDWTCF